MEDLGNDAVLFEDGIPLWVDVDLEVDDDGQLAVVIDLTVDEFDEITIKRPLFEIVEGLLEDNDYQMLYTVANELVRESERLREKAQRIEDSTANVSDLFDADYEST
jgi:hypothetical protein